MIQLYVFSSNHCQPCKSFKEELKKECVMFKEMNFDNMNDEERSWSKQFRIMSLPTSLIMEGKNVKKQFVGKVPVNLIKNYLR